MKDLSLRQNFHSGYTAISVVLWAIFLGIKKAGH
jgi:hypothetical protein